MAAREAVAEFVHDGDYLTVGGFSTNRRPMALLHEVVRQRRKELGFAGHSATHDFQVLAAGGCLNRCDVAYVVGLEARGLSRNARRAMESGQIEAAEWSNAALAWRFHAAAMGVPFLPARVMLGTDTFRRSAAKTIDCPFTGATLAALPALSPDVAMLHVHRCDELGNAQIDGITVCDLDIARAAKRLIVSTERLVPNDEIRRTPHCTAIPYYCVDAVVVAPFGAYPCNMPYEYYSDEAHLQAWLKAENDEAEFAAFLERYIYRRGRLRGLPSAVRRQGAAGSTDAGGAPGAPRGGSVMAECTQIELMVCAAARQLEDGAAVVVGTGAPCAAAMLAQRLWAPNLLIMFEAGGIGPLLPTMPISVGDSRTFHRGVLAGSMVEIMEMCQRGLVDYAFLGAGQIDMYGNINSTIVGDSYHRPKVRFPGSGGANDLASLCRRTIVMTPQDRRRFVARLDFLTTPGYLGGKGAREEAGLPAGTGPYKVITDLCIMGFAADSCRMQIESLHEGVSREQAQEQTGFELLVTPDVALTPRPSDEELRVLRDEVDPYRYIIGR
jgi:acyl CoA:acetate/3-ketoacid CoA transferase alpha subunit/acyl CoA:acetate/3-ketoacid CoA transferase beta subunit